MSRFRVLALRISASSVAWSRRYRWCGTNCIAPFVTFVSFIRLWGAVTPFVIIRSNDRRSVESWAGMPG